jgi:hypothetical protein
MQIEFDTHYGAAKIVQVSGAGASMVFHLMVKGFYWGQIVQREEKWVVLEQKPVLTEEEKQEIAERIREEIDCPIRYYSGLQQL